MSKPYLATGLPWLELATQHLTEPECPSGLACDLAARGLVVFGGLAQGVGSAAHSSAITTKGKTVAIFGTGADVVYPRRTESRWINYFRYAGAVILEFPVGTAPTPQNFPIRNRTISEISIGVLVIEPAK